MLDDEFPANGQRIIDIGGTPPEMEEDPEDFGDEKNLVLLSLDPGETTGWSAMRVPVAALRQRGAARTLQRCWWAHGTIQRSGIGTGSMAQAVSDSRHVTNIFGLMDRVFEEFVHTADDGEGGLDVFDEFVLVMENFKLRMMSMDENLLAPVRIKERLLDRLWVARSPLPVFLQAPSDAKKIVSDERLRTWGMYRSNSGPHARDADRHAILFLRRFASERAIRERLGYDW